MKTFLLATVVTVTAGLGAHTAAQIADYGAAQLARQAVDIRAAYLAQMAQLRYQQQTEKTPTPGATRTPPETRFKRSTSWFKP